MVLGIIGVLAFGFFAISSIAAIITGHMAQRSQPHAKGFWLTGLITGYAGLGIFVIGLLLIFGLMAVYPNACVVPTRVPPGWRGACPPPA